jgi:sporulation protein YlmC with PRC-barrel domain
MHDRGFISTAPASGIQASDLIGAKVRSTDDENVGSVDDVIIDENGQVVAIIVGVGGFLGLGQKDVAISWDNVTRSGAVDDPELRVDVTRESLLNAPEFERRD